MTPTPQQSYREGAARDMEAITALKKSPHFTDYFLRRVRGRMAELDSAFRYEECDAAKRETYRQQLLLLEWITGSVKTQSFMQVDEANCRKELMKVEGAP